jgi:MinD-like ATPase involved in chromosome partitioning or flagellar assembly
VRLPVLLAVPDAEREARLVAAYEAADAPVRVVRRCVDLADLLTAAATGTARAAVVSAATRRLDRDALSRLAVHGVATVGLADDDAGERRLRQLGVRHVLGASAGPAAVADAVVAAVAEVTLGAVPSEPEEPAPEPEPTGTVIAVWGPTGAPGRTTLAVNLAAELAALRLPTTLVDADVYGGAVAQALGLLDESPGLAAAARLANNGLLDRPGLAQLARTATDDLYVLTGVTRADRWTELRPAAVENVLDLCRGLTPYTVVDCAFCLEDDETRRNAATLAAVHSADTVLAVGSADPVSLQRLVRGLAALGRDATVVVNRLRDTVVPGDAKAEIAHALSRYAGVEPAAFLPYDRDAADRALARGQTLAEAAPQSPLRTAVSALARTLSGAAPEPRRRLLSRR